MPACSAPNCTNRPERPNNKTFHLFPKDGPLRQKWMKEVNREYWTPSKRSLLCSDHFTESCFDRTGQTTRLRENAVPTLFDVPSPKKKKPRIKEEPQEPDALVPAVRGRPRKKPKQETPVKLSREELEAKLQLLEEHNKKLTKLLSRSPKPSTTLEAKKTEKKDKSNILFRYPRRQILLKIAYLGWDYHSSASQEEIQQNIEDKLLQALLQTNLSECLSSTKFERIGSCDEGFSPFDQVITVTVRSNLKSGLGVIVPDKRNQLPQDNLEFPLCVGDSGEQEIDYSLLVNSALPVEIRILAWCPVDVGYLPDSKIPLKTFKYFFPRGNLDVDAMNDAAQHLVGENDYRNLYTKEASKDLGSIRRRVRMAQVTKTCCDLKVLFSDTAVCHPDNEAKENLNKKHVKGERKRKHSESSDVMNTTDDGLNLDGYDMCVATLKGQFFIIEEIRKIMGVLLSIGEGKMEPNFISTFLDVTKHPRKAQQLIASEVPLVLFKTSYEEEEWHWDRKALHQVIAQLQAFWMQQSVRATAMRHILKDLENEYINNTSKDESPDPLPQDQCKNLISKDSSTLHIGGKSSQNDHEYSTAKPSATPTDSQNQDEADFNHTATLLLIEFIRQKFQRFLLMNTRATVYKEVQEELCFRGFSFPVSKIRKKWNNLIATYRRIKEKNSEDPKAKIMWDYYQLLDDLLGTTVLTATPESTESQNGFNEKYTLSPVSSNQVEDLPLVKSTSPTKASASLRSASSPIKSIATLKTEGVKSTMPVHLSVPIKTEPSEAPVIHIMHSPSNLQSLSPQSTNVPLATEKTVVVQTSAHEKEETVKVKTKASEPATVFLEYQIEQGEKRLDVMDEYFQYMKDRLLRKMDYRRQKEQRESRNIKVLKEIGDSSENMKIGLLELKSS